MRVFVYFNLHRRLWSVKALEGPNKGRVVAHSDQVGVTDAEFRVSEAGRQRVIRDKRKNVHAGVVGQWTPAPCVPADALPTEVSYNPYRAGHFYARATGEAFHSARLVLLAAASRSVVAFA